MIIGLFCLEALVVFFQKSGKIINSSKSDGIDSDLILFFMPGSSG